MWLRRGGDQAARLGVGGDDTDPAREGSVAAPRSMGEEAERHGFGMEEAERI